MRSRHFALFAAAIFLAAAAGCNGERAPEYPKWKDRVELFRDIEKLAIVPVRESGKMQWPKEFGPEQLGTLFADEIVRRARFKVIYPRDVLAGIERANIETRAKAVADNRPLGRDDVIDLARSEEDVTAAGRAVGADAVLVITVSDFDPYPPKRLALTMRVYICAAPVSQDFRDILEMSDAGVPLDVPAALRERFIWERQKHYDSRRKNVQTGLEWHAAKHSDNTGFGDEIFYYSTEAFLGFVADELSAILCSDANRYKSIDKDKKKAALTGVPAGPERTQRFELEQEDRGIRH